MNFLLAALTVLRMVGTVLIWTWAMHEAMKTFRKQYSSTNSHMDFVY